MQQCENIELANLAAKDGEFGFKPDAHEIINEHLKEHQIAVDWDKKELVQDLHIWRERFVLEFKLKIEEMPAIMIARIGRSAYGHFRPGRNGFGLRNEVAINESYIDSRKYWQVIGTFLHELLHAEQEQSGKPGKYNYHNKAFRERAASFGLIVDQWGYMQYAPAPSPFWNILDKYGVAVTDTDKGLNATAAIAPVPTTPGNSKLKLWICECTPKPVHVRVAIEDFQAKCLKCGAIFHKAGKDNV